MTNKQGQNKHFSPILLGILSLFSFTGTYISLAVLVRHFKLDMPLFSIFGDSVEIISLIPSAMFLALLVATMISLLAYPTYSHNKYWPNKVLLLFFLAGAYIVYCLLTPLPSAAAMPFGKLKQLVLIFSFVFSFIAAVIFLYQTAIHSIITVLAHVIIFLASALTIYYFTNGYGACIGKGTSCLAEKAVKYSNLAYCERARAAGESEECAEKVFKNTQATLQFCQTARSVELRDRCALWLARYGRSDFCQQIISPNQSDECLIIQIKEAKSATECLNVPKEKSRNECLILLQQKFPDIASCVHVTAAEDREKCIKASAIKQRKVQFCRALRDQENRDQCLLEIVGTEVSDEICALLSSKNRSLCQGTNETLVSSAFMEEQVDGVIPYHLWVRCNKIEELESCLTIVKLLMEKSDDPNLAIEYRNLADKINSRFNAKENKKVGDIPLETIEESFHNHSTSTLHAPNEVFKSGDIVS